MVPCQRRDILPQAKQLSARAGSKIVPGRLYPPRAPFPVWRSRRADNPRSFDPFTIVKLLEGPIARFDQAAIVFQSRPAIARVVVQIDILGCPRLLDKLPRAAIIHALEPVGTRRLLEVAVRILPFRATLAHGRRARTRSLELLRLRLVALLLLDNQLLVGQLDD